MFADNTIIKSYCFYLISFRKLLVLLLVLLMKQLIFC